MMQKKSAQAASGIRTGAVQPSAQPLVETSSTWPFGSLGLWQSSGIPRGEILATGGYSACLRVRTTDGKTDRKTINEIAKTLSLNARSGSSPAFSTQKLAMTIGSNPQVRSIRLEVKFRLEISRRKHHYSISVSSPGFDASETERLAIDIAKELFALKEKPHFSDESAAAFEKALALL